MMITNKISRTILFTLLCFFTFAKVNAQIENISFDELKTRMDSTSGIVVYNFWATWCKPCIAELPYFEKANTLYSPRGVKINLINLDFNSKVESVAIPFVKERGITSKVIHITDTDPNKWINHVDSTWSGAIPATIIFKNGMKAFFVEGEITFESLSEEIDKLLR